ncbi:hypothetical protein FPOAC2_00227 [Fusarium poae]|jgi:hypothetical protein|uniref:hypothetical protein n=1 Tax=Fusarium poae TaxID=36050 RepID=UPI001CEB137D|nr:hypothetical protein FPOAC1_000203 [Fusarium poae]KAG8674239.1 hypothetical protein FPOAC1_000203 [Fusarium poae]
MSKAIEAQKRRAMVPAIAGLSLLGFGVYYLGRKPAEDFNVTGSNGVIGAGGASKGNVSTSLQETFGTGGSTAGTTTDYETKDTRAVSNMTGIYTKREAGKEEGRQFRNPLVPKGESKKQEDIVGVTGSPGK